jgi:hypothetical protein
MTEDVFVLDCHSDIFVWVGQEVDAKVKLQAMDIGEVKPKLSSHSLIRNHDFYLFLTFFVTVTARNFLFMISLWKNYHEKHQYSLCQKVASHIFLLDSSTGTTQNLL